MEPADYLAIADPFQPTLHEEIQVEIQFLILSLVPEVAAEAGPEVQLLPNLALMVALEEAETDIILILLVAQEMFLTQVHPLQDYKATTEAPEPEDYKEGLSPVAVVEQVQLDQTQCWETVLQRTMVQVALAELEEHPIYQVLPQQPVAAEEEAVTHMVVIQVQVALVAAEAHLPVQQE